MHFATLLLIICFWSCNTDNDILPTERPSIEFDNADGIYTVKIGQELRIDPIVENADKATYDWTLNGKTVGTERALVMRWEQLGSFYVMLTVTSGSVSVSEEARVDVVELTPPIIDLSLPTEGIYTLPEQEYKFTPRFKNSDVDNFNVVWSVDGVAQSTDINFTFSSKSEGRYLITIKAFNDDGEAEASTYVNVVAELPRSLTFESPSLMISDNTRYTFAGRSVILTPTLHNIAIDAPFEWSVNGVKQTNDKHSLQFTPQAPGNYNIEVTSDGATANVTVVCVEATEQMRKRQASASSSAYANKVWEYIPAPGQFINDNSSIGGMPSDMTSHSEACQWALNRLNSNLPVSLGACCGYIVVGFDHSIEAGKALYDIAIGGNAFDRSNEPGTVWVMQDVNGNGVPDDEWYELKGSDYNDPSTIQNYAVTYYRPAGSGMDVNWKDNLGSSGSVKYIGEYHSQMSYYPAWVETSSYTLRGTRLKSRAEYNSVTGEWYTLPAEWGYADNLGSDTFSAGNSSAGGSGQCVGLRIDNAIMTDGSPISLNYIDFVCVRSGVMSNLGRIGETSTEVFSVADYDLLVK